MKTLHDRLVAQYDHIRIHRTHPDGTPFSKSEALQAAIDEVYTMRPDWARADLYAKLMENWNDYVGIALKIHVRHQLMAWENWYVREGKPPVQETKE